MKTKPKSTSEEKARFDVRLKASQKELFEKAAYLGGYKTLSEFALTTLQDKANEIIKENEDILASKRDKEIFFNEITNPQKPNKALKSALKDYNEFIK